MERLTIKNSDDTYSQPTHTTFEKMFYKLAEFEDFMEENGFEDLEDLKNKINSWVDEDKAKKLAEETIKNYLKSINFQKQINDLTMYKVMWQNFKEYIDDELELIETIKDPIEQYEYWCLEGAERTHKLIKDKMQEIEELNAKICIKSAKTLINDDKNEI